MSVSTIFAGAVQEHNLHVKMCKAVQKKFKQHNKGSTYRASTARLLLATHVYIQCSCFSCNMTTKVTEPRILDILLGSLAEGKGPATLENIQGAD